MQLWIELIEIPIFKDPGPSQVTTYLGIDEEDLWKTVLLHIEKWKKCFYDETTGKENMNAGVLLVFHNTSCGCDAELPSNVGRAQWLSVRHIQLAWWST